MVCNIATARGVYSEDTLYEFVNKYRGLSIYEIAKKLGWSCGKVHGIVKRLEEKGLVKTVVAIENNRVKRKVFPVDWIELLA